jgi:hypothetical protein
LFGRGAERFNASGGETRLHLAISERAYQFAIAMAALAFGRGFICVHLCSSVVNPVPPV